MYLYQINYPQYEKQICFLEMKALFDDEIKDPLFFHWRDVDEGRSVFIKWKINILYQDDQFERLCQKLRQAQLYYEDFKVQYIKNATNHIDYKETLLICKTLAECMDGSCDMHKPKIIFAITKIHQQWIFGIYHQNNEAWRKHDDKPFTYSYSLSVRDARTCLNILMGQQLHKTLVDPCCGIGTVVLEALSMNINVKGYDINREVVRQAQKNLAYYQYENVIACRDMHTLEDNFDCAFMDIPYGVYTPITRQQQVDLIMSCRRLCSRALIITFEPMDDVIMKANFKILQRVQVSKQRFTRYIYVLD